MKRFRKNDIIALAKHPKPGDKFLVIYTENNGQKAEAVRYANEGYSAKVTFTHPEDFYLHGRCTLFGMIKDFVCFWKWDWSWLI